MGPVSGSLILFAVSGLDRKVFNDLNGNRSTDF